MHSRLTCPRTPRNSVGISYDPSSGPVHCTLVHAGMSTSGTAQRSRYPSATTVNLNSHRNLILPQRVDLFLGEGGLFLSFSYCISSLLQHPQPAGNVVKSQKRDLYCYVKDQPWFQKLGGLGRLTCQMRLAPLQAFPACHRSPRAGTTTKEITGLFAKMVTSDLLLGKWRNGEKMQYALSRKAILCQLW